MITGIASKTVDRTNDIRSFAFHGEFGNEDEARGAGVAKLMKDQPGYSIETITVLDLTAPAIEFAERNRVHVPQSIEPVTVGVSDPYPMEEEPYPPEQEVLP